MTDRRRHAPIFLPALLTLTWALPIAAQVTQPAQGSGPVQGSGPAQVSDAAAADRPAGWSLVPAVGVAQMWDSNPSLAAEGSVRAGDFLTAVQPSVTLGFRGRRTSLRTDYAALSTSIGSERTRPAGPSRDARLHHQLTRRVRCTLAKRRSCPPTTANASLAGATGAAAPEDAHERFRGGVRGIGLGRARR